MARPQKIGLDYFPLNVDIDQDDKIALIESQHGIIGFGVVIKLLMKIYSEGYYYDWTEKEQILFSKRVNVDIKEVDVIINDCLKWDLFDKNLLETFEILTSRGIQKRYFEVVKRRQKVEVIKELLLLDNADINLYSNIVIVNINDDTDDINADINPQIKVNEIKVNENIYSPVIEHLNFKCNTKYRTTTKKTQDLIKARQNEGFTLEDFKKVIDIKSAEWLNTDMAKYLRPETLFGTKFEGYLNQGEPVKPKPQSKPNKFNDNMIKHDDNIDLEALAEKRRQERRKE